MPLDQVITKLPFLKIVETLNHGITKFFAVGPEASECLYCRSKKLRLKDTFIRRLRHISIGESLSELHLKSHKYYCLDCGRYFNQRFEGILPRKRATEPFRREIARKHHDGISQATLAYKHRLSTSTVEKWYQDFIYYEHQKIHQLRCPKVMGIDEHFFTHKKGYATTFVDLGRQRVFDVKLGRSEASLRGYLEKLEGRANVRVMLMDLSETYRTLVKKYFHNALIVADRFHVIRLVNHHFMSVWKQLDPEGKYNRGLLSLMRRHEWKLTSEQKSRLVLYLDKVTGLRPLYEFKQDLVRLLSLKTLKRWECRLQIPQFLAAIEQLKQSGFKNMRSLGKTLESWSEEIVRMWRFTKTNSITEGLHNKMEMLSRRAYGFRNFENYRLRVKVHCGYGS